MRHSSPHNRILSLDIRSKTIAYAVFEDFAHLLDFGVSGSRQDSFQAARVEKLVRKFQPDVIVLSGAPRGSTRDTPSVRAGIKSIRSRARRLFVPVLSIGRHSVVETFGRHCKPTKYPIAVLIASSFPALTWYVPCKRKIYMPEDRRMQYFDATAVGLTYYATNGDAEGVHQLLARVESSPRPLTSGA